jgi:hypothetical protein
LRSATLAGWNNKATGEYLVLNPSTGRIEKRYTTPPAPPTGEDGLVDIAPEQNPDLPAQYYEDRPNWFDEGDTSYQDWMKSLGIPDADRSGTIDDDERPDWNVWNSDDNQSEVERLINQAIWEDFSKIDLNQDGQFTPDEHEALLGELFSEGAISVDDFLAEQDRIIAEKITEVGEGTREEILDRHPDLQDWNKDGVIDSEDLTIHILTDGYPRLNDDGSISREEAKAQHNERIRTEADELVKKGGLYKGVSKAEEFFKILEDMLDPTNMPGIGVKINNPAGVIQGGLLNIPGDPLQWHIDPATGAIEWDGHAPWGIGTGGTSGGGTYPTAPGLGDILTGNSADIDHDPDFSELPDLTEDVGIPDDDILDDDTIDDDIITDSGDGSDDDILTGSGDGSDDDILTGSGDGSDDDILTGPVEPTAMVLATMTS